MDNLDTVISLLQPGVDDISRKCGPAPAKRIISLINKLRYLQRDAAKYFFELQAILDQTRVEHH